MPHFRGRPMKRNQRHTHSFLPVCVRRSLLCGAAAVLLACVPAFAQLSGKGEIRGTVTDTTGAAVPNATVVITNPSTGISVTTTSTSAGDYSVPTLDPGVYSVTFSAAGFEKLTQQNVTVNALESQTVNPKLPVGATN